MSLSVRLPQVRMFFLLFLLKLPPDFRQLTSVGSPPRVSVHLGHVFKRFPHIILRLEECVLGQRPSEVRRSLVRGRDLKLWNLGSSTHQMSSLEVKQR